MTLFQILRCTVSYISNRYSQAKNKYLKYYDPKQESKHTIYLDAKNLYGYAMSKLLPISGFKLIDRKEFELNKYSSNSSKGCVPKLDLNDYPLTLDKIEIKREMSSNYQ